MDIVDSQVHSTVLPTDAVLAIMDALGIQSVLIDEFEWAEADASLRPSRRLANGAWRPVGPKAEAAALAHPDRFAYLMRINPFDPELDAWVESLAASPGLRALRTVVFGPSDGPAFEGGGYDALFRAADRHGLPVFVTCPDRVRHLEPYARAFPDLSFIIDHCGASFEPPRGPEAQAAALDDTVHMASFPNVALKWCRAPALLSLEAYPFADLEPLLERVLEAYGRERLMWASDYTRSRERQNWGESLFAIRHSPSLSEGDRAWILGRTARTLLDWPAPARPLELQSMHIRPGAASS